MKDNRLQAILVVLLSGVLVFACGEGVGVSDTPGLAEDTGEGRSTRQPAVQSPAREYAVVPVQPPFGSTLTAGQPVTIEWWLVVGTADAGTGGGSAGLMADFIKLELYKGGNFHSTIAESLLLESWTYVWQVPANLPTGSDYSIRLSSVADPTLFSGTGNFNIIGTTCTYKFDVYSLYVARDQRTRTFNYEGKLELAGVFRVATTVTPRFPATGELSLAQGTSSMLGLFVAALPVSAPTTVPLEARLWELEHGAQGSDDFGSMQGAMSLNCATWEVTQSLAVTLSEDSGLEEEGQVIVRFRARIQ